ncbi:MAG TPA: hypothetical protein VHC43_02415 [Mycobacteriales bacterium]|nr:hypothetical protein [Mycobacteriales bacterium]
MRSVRATRRLAAAAAAAVLGLSGCGLTHLQDLSFRVDKRLHFVSPKSRALVHQPVTVSWTMSDFTIAAQGSQPPSRDAGYFAVFVDGTPIKPGQTLKSVAHGDPACEADPKCPSLSYLHQHLVFPTTATSIKLPLIPDLSNNKEKDQLHRITIVLMDTSGHRTGESAWELDVRIPKAAF